MPMANGARPEEISGTMGAAEPPERTSLEAVQSNAMGKNQFFIFNALKMHYRVYEYLVTSVESDTIFTLRLVPVLFPAVWRLQPSRYPYRVLLPDQ